MTPETRNTRVTVCLVVSMTLGAATLMWMDPGTRAPAGERDAFLTAARGTPVEALVIEVVPPSQRELLSDFECVILPTGAEPVWHPDRLAARQVRVAVAGSDDGQLSDEQALVLLRVLGSLKHHRGLPLSSVRLHPDSDVRYRTDLPPQAFALRELLLRKGILRE